MSRLIKLYLPGHRGRFPHFCQVSPWEQLTPLRFGHFPKNLVLPANPQSLLQEVQGPNWQSTVEFKKHYYIHIGSFFTTVISTYMRRYSKQSNQYACSNDQDQQKRQQYFPSFLT